MKKYDALYIFVGIAKDDALEANLEKALAEIIRLGGNVLSKDSLSMPKKCSPRLTPLRTSFPLLSKTLVLSFVSDLMSNVFSMRYVSLFTSMVRVPV